MSLKFLKQRDHLDPKGTMILFISRKQQIIFLEKVSTVIKDM